MKMNYTKRQAANESGTGRFHPKQAGHSALSLDEQIRAARIRLAVASKPLYKTGDLITLGLARSRTSAHRLARMLSEKPFAAMAVGGLIPDRVWNYAGKTQAEAVGDLAKQLAALEAAKPEQD